MKQTAVYREEELFRLISAGDQDAFACLFELYHARLFSFIFRLVKSSGIAGDAVQDIFIKCWVNREQLNGISNPNAYLFTMAHHRALDYLRQATRRKEIYQDILKHFSDVQFITQQQLDLRESHAIISRAISQLTPQKRKIFEMSRYEGLTHEQIGQKLGLSSSTVKGHIKESLHFIKAFVASHTAAVTVGIAINLFLEK